MTDLAPFPPPFSDPLPYHKGIREYLRAEEPEVWDWYASNKVRDEQADSIHFDLLKSIYRIERETWPQLYQVAEEVATKLSLDVPITIYQAQNSSRLNASLAYLPHEAHLVLHGPITSNSHRSGTASADWPRAESSPAMEKLLAKAAQ